MPSWGRQWVRFVYVYQDPLCWTSKLKWKLVTSCSRQWGKFDNSTGYINRQKHGLVNQSLFYCWRSMRQECHLTRCNITEKIAALDLPLGGQELKTEIASIHSHLGGLNSSDFADRVMSGHPCPGPARPVIGRKQLSIFWGCVGLIWFLQLITVNKCSLTMVLVKSDSDYTLPQNIQHYTSGRNGSLTPGRCPQVFLHPGILVVWAFCWSSGPD